MYNTNDQVEDFTITIKEPWVTASKLKNSLEEREVLSMAHVKLT
jgi:hypothetical protein